ncbi:MAG: hypothetical protein GY765_27685 [bacterium]|nr:hypothetical protein [bacterium]
MDVTFEESPDEERSMPETLRPNFAEFSLYPDNPDLKGPDFEKMKTAPLVWAFYSFKGGVSRTLHMISLVKALSEQSPPKKVLIVDADLEAPGLTWWAEDQLGKTEISFPDFLALAHYDKSTDHTGSIKTAVELLRRQMIAFETSDRKVEHYFLPAFREISQLMRMPLRPEHVCWESGKEWLIAELLHKLGTALNVDAVVVDLRAGLSEISSPLLFDPRVNRIIVTTPSGQSVHGTCLILEQCKKYTNALPKENGDCETKTPTVILSMMKEETKETAYIEKVKEKLIRSADDGIVENNLEAEVVQDSGLLLESLFDENLLLLKDLPGTLDKLDTTKLHNKVMKKIAAEWSRGVKGTEVKREDQKKTGDSKNYQGKLKALKETALKYEFAEDGKADTFLITSNLKTIARNHINKVPVAVIMGAKGSGKTYTYLQLARLQKWDRFVRVVENEVEGNFGSILPLVRSKNINSKALSIIRDCGEKFKGHFTLQGGIQIENLINKQKDTGLSDTTSWRNFWFRMMADSLSCPDSENPLEAMQALLKKKDKRVVFLVDGLEDYFREVAKDKVQQAAVEALCLSMVGALQDCRDNRIGLLIFIRKDIAKSAITQNFGQFESRFRTLELKWNWTEAIRLVAWLVQKAVGDDILKIKQPLENVSSDTIEEALQHLWGLKLGPPRSKEAYTAKWVMAALSDFNAQLQARDVIRLIRFAATNALDLKSYPVYPGRLLPPAAIKKALPPCSKKKIEEISEEITVLKDIFEKLKSLDKSKRRSPFDRDELGLSIEDITIMSRLGIIVEHEGKYYFPEIIRHGLDFSLASRGRLKVLNLLKKALNE